MVNTLAVICKTPGFEIILQKKNVKEHCIAKKNSSEVKELYENSLFSHVYKSNQGSTNKLLGKISSSVEYNEQP